MRAEAPAYALVVLALMVAALQAQTSPNLSPKAVAAAASAYVEKYNAQMQYVLADEEAVQQVAGPDGVEVARRKTRAEFFITFLPAESTWITVRDVKEVDGAAVSDPDNIRALIDRAPLYRLGSVIAEKNARFNIGSVSRTFNEPTLALLVVTAKNRDRFRFDRAGVTAGPSPRVTLSFRERERPTLVSSETGAPVFSTGELIVDAETGRVERTRIQFAFATETAGIETIYGEDAKLKMWVPSVMREVYEEKAKGLEQTIRVESKYTNYRKFDTNVIIK